MRHEHEREQYTMMMDVLTSSLAIDVQLDKMHEKTLRQQRGGENNVLARALSNASTRGYGRRRSLRIAEVIGQYSSGRLAVMMKINPVKKNANDDRFQNSQFSTRGDVDDLGSINGRFAEPRWTMLMGRVLPSTSILLVGFIVITVDQGKEINIL